MALNVVIGANTSAPSLACQKRRYLRVRHTPMSIPRMGETKNRRGTVTPENREEAARLKRLWLDAQPALRKQGLGSQEAFGAHFGIGNHAAVGFFLNGNTALSAKAAKGFATGLGCDVSAFSPRLAAFLAAPTPINPGATPSWPLRRWTPEQWSAIDPLDRAVMEDAAMTKWRELQSERSASTFAPPEKRQANGK